MNELKRIYKVADSFWAGVYPGTPRPRKDGAKINYLLRQGVRRFINLMEPDEADHLGRKIVQYDQALRKAACELGVRADMIRVPIRDGMTPSGKQMRLILALIDKSIQDGEPVYVHCWGGHGRTGTVVGCWLADHGKAGWEALRTLDRLRRNDPTGKPSPQTLMQIMMVVGWAEKG